MGCEAFIPVAHVTSQFTCWQLTGRRTLSNYYPLILTSLTPWIPPKSRGLQRSHQEDVVLLMTVKLSEHLFCVVQPYRMRQGFSRSINSITFGSLFPARLFWGCLKTIPSCLHKGRKELWSMGRVCCIPVWIISICFMRILLKGC